jgi:hypothetical protein
MRFSLSTLLIIVFWLAAILLAWLWREPWVFDKITPAQPSFITEIAPDGRRMVSNRTFKFSVVEVVKRTDFTDMKRVLWTLDQDTFFEGRSLIAFGFVDDDTIFCESFITGTPSPNNAEQLLFRRRFPEWWWGHFYRPEVWLAIALSGVLLVRASRAIRARFRPVGTT